MVLAELLQRTPQDREVVALGEVRRAGPGQTGLVVLGLGLGRLIGQCPLGVVIVELLLFLAVASV